MSNIQTNVSKINNKVNYSSLNNTNIKTTSTSSNNKNSVDELDLSMPSNGKLDYNKIDFSKISSGRDDALNGNFFSEDSLLTEYWKGDLTYSKDSNGIVAIYKGDTLMGFTQEKYLKNSNSVSNKDNTKVEEVKIDKDDVYNQVKNSMTDKVVNGVTYGGAGNASDFAITGRYSDGVNSLPKENNRIEIKPIKTDVSIQNKDFKEENLEIYGEQNDKYYSKGLFGLSGISTTSFGGGLEIVYTKKEKDSDGNLIYYYNNTVVKKIYSNGSIELSGWHHSLYTIDSDGERKHLSYRRDCLDSIIADCADKVVIDVSGYKYFYEDSLVMTGTRKNIVTKILNYMDKEVYSCNYDNGIKNEKWRKYDDNGNELYYEDNKGNIGEYDINHNLIHEIKNFSEHTIDIKYKYDENNNVIQKNIVYSDGYSEEYKYNSNGKEIYYSDSNGGLNEYDENYNLIHKITVSSDGKTEDHKYEYDTEKNLVREIINYDDGGLEEYDKNKNVVHKIVFQDGQEIDYKYEYDENNNIIREIETNGDKITECKKNYDENNNIINEIVIDNIENLHEYDSKRNLIHEISTDPNDNDKKIDYKYEYNSKNQVIHETRSYEDGNIDDYKYEYDENNNRTIIATLADNSWYKRKCDSNWKEIYYEDSTGRLNEYDENCNLIHKIDFENGEKIDYKYEYEYDKSKNIVHKIVFQNGEKFDYKYEYDTDNNKIYELETKSDNSWDEYKFDKNGNEIYYKNSYGGFREYDENNKKIRELVKFKDGTEHDYNDFDENGISQLVIYTDSDGQKFKMKYQPVSGGGVYYISEKI